MAMMRERGSSPGLIEIHFRCSSSVRFDGSFHRMSVVTPNGSRKSLVLISAGSIAGSVPRLPGLIVAGGLGAPAAGQDRAGGPVGHRSPRQVGNMRLLPGMRLIGLFGRREVDGVVDPAVP